MKSLVKVLIFLGAAAILSSCTFSTGAAHKGKGRVIVSAQSPAKASSRSLAAARGMSRFPAAKVAARSLVKDRLLSTGRKISTARSLSAGSKVAAPRPHALPAGLQPSVSKVGKRPKAATLAAMAKAAPRSRDLSAYNDIEYMTYEIDNLDPNSGEDPIWDYIDPYYPYVDIFLTPGQSYRIYVDVVLWSDSPSAIAGTNVGIDGFGDSADFWVPDDGSDVWVDLMVHPLGSAFLSQLTGSVTKSATIWDAVSQSPSSHQVAAASVFPTTGPLDKFFYSSDNKLYYFNKAANAVYEWTDIGQLMGTTTPAISGSQAITGFGFDITLSSVCADPGYPGWFWAVGYDNDPLNLGWEYYAIYGDPNPANDLWYVYASITTDMGNGTDTVVPTGIAADLYGDAYISFYNTGLSSNGPLISGVIEYDSSGSWYWADIPDTTLGWTRANSVITDLFYAGGNIYALASPNTSAGPSDHNIGTADVLIYDTYMDLLSFNPSAVSFAYSSGTAITLSNTSLTLPNKFAGMVLNGYLLVDQSDFVAGVAEVLSAVSLDLSSVTALP